MVEILVGGLGGLLVTIVVFPWVAMGVVRYLDWAFSKNDTLWRRKT